MTPEQSASFYTFDQALDRLGVDETQLARLTATMRAPLWYKLGDQIVYARTTVDQMAAERSTAARAAPSPATQSLSSIIADQAVIKVGEGSPYVRQMQEAAGALLAGFRAVDDALHADTLTEAQAQHLAACITCLADEMRETAASE